MAAVDAQAKHNTNRDSSSGLGSLAASSLFATAATAAEGDSDVELLDRPKTALTNSGDTSNTSNTSNLQTYDKRKLTPLCQGSSRQHTG